MSGILGLGKVQESETRIVRSGRIGRGVAAALVAMTMVVASSAPAQAFDRFERSPQEGRISSGIESSFLQTILDLIGSVLSDTGILIDPNGSPGSLDAAAPPPTGSASNGETS